jgi:hypothetical protein
MKLTAEGRDTVYRFRDDPSTPRDVTFYCEKCGAANAIALTVEMLSELLRTLTSDDPDIQKAIDDARRGDYGSAIDEARRRFGF